MTWFYESNREQKGPVSDTELDVLIANRQVLPTTLVWREGMPGWQPLQTARPQAATASAPTEGAVRCDSCGRYFPPGEVIQLGGRQICAACKPLALQALQQGDTFASLDEASRTGPSWEHLETLGFLNAGWRTIKEVISQPSPTFTNMRCNGGLSRPLWYYVLTSGIGLTAYFVYFGGLMLISPDFRQGFTQEQAEMSGPILAAIAIGLLIWAFLGSLISIFLYSGVVHLCLKATGGATRPFEATFRALAYSGGTTNLLQVVPFVGSFVSGLAFLVYTIIGLTKVHQTDLWRVVLAFFLPALICCGGAAVIAIFAAALGNHH